MNDTAISTIIPTYNRAHFLTRSINSVLIQLEPDDELIIIDDGSTDNTKGIVSRFGNRVQYIRTPNNGAGAARNKGVQEARNPLVAFADSDDEWMPNKIELQRAFMKSRTDVLFCFSNFAFWNKKGIEEPFSLGTWHDDRRSWDEILGPGQHFSSFAALCNNINDFKVHIGDISLPALSSHFLNINTLLVRREKAGDALRFAEDTKTYEEWECLVRLSSIGKCAYFDCETAWQHAHNEPRLTDAGSYDVLDAKIRIMDRVWRENADSLKEHGTFFQKVFYEYLLHKVGLLILLGHTKEAREVIPTLPSCPLPYRILTAMPGCIAQPAARMLRKIRNVLLR